MGLEHFDTVLSFAVVMLLLSLQVTILVQVVVAISGLRGWNLSWSLTQLLKQIGPTLNLEGYTTKLSREILKHPALTHTWTLLGRRKATAIRPAELLRVLEDLATNPNSALDTAAKQTVAAALGKTVAGQTPELAEKAGEVVAALATQFPGQAQVVQDAVAQVFQQKKQLEVEVSAWFDTVMDRSTERFILYTRWVTAVIAFALAFFLHVDSIRIFKHLSSSSDVRAKIVQHVDATVRQAGTALTETATPKPLASDAIHAMTEDMEAQSDKDLLTRAPADLATRQAGQDWLKRNFTEPTLTKVLAAYETRFEAATLARLKELGVSLDTVKASIDQTGLQIFPQPIPHWKAYLGDSGLHFLGVVMTGLFLSLGAPFWFNALSQLAKLRPVLAGKVEAPKTEDKAA